MDLHGTHCFVTGASRGIGEGIARELARRSARVTLVARSAGPLETLASEIGGRVLTADLSDRAQVASLVPLTESAGGPIDVLVNNAGIDLGMAFVDATPEEIDQIEQLNLVTPIQLTRAVLPGMLERGRGHIVNVSSLASAAGFPGMALYCSTKAGLSHFTRVLREDLKRTPIGLTAVEPGPVPTDMLSGLQHDPIVRSFDRFRRLRLLRDVPVSEVAERTARAIERGSHTVVLPRRAAGFSVLTGASQRIVSAVIRSIG